MNGTASRHVGGDGEDGEDSGEENPITRSEVEELREAVRVRDELLDEMQIIMAKKAEEANQSVASIQHLLMEQEEVYEKRLGEKEKQIGFLKQILDTHGQATGKIHNDGVDKKAQSLAKHSSPSTTSSSTTTSNNTTSQITSAIIASTLSDADDDIGEIPQEDSVLNDYLFKVLAKRDSLQDQLHDMTEELILTKTTLGSSELEKERALQEVRRLKRVLDRHEIEFQSRISAILNPEVDFTVHEPSKQQVDEVEKRFQEKTVTLENELKKNESRLKRKETLRMNDQFKFKKEVQALEQEKVSLNNRVLELEKRDGEYSQTNTSLVEEIESIKANLEQEATTVNKLTQENENLRSTVAKFVEEDAASEVKELHTTIVHLSDTIISREDTISSLTAKADALTSEAEVLKKTLMMQEATIKTKENVERDFMQSQDHVSSLESSLEQTTLSLNTTQKLCENMEKEITALTLEISELKLTVEELKEVKREHENVVHQQSLQIERLETQQTELNKLRLMLKGRSDEMEQREAFINEIEKRFKAEQKLRRALHDQLMELRGNIRVQCRVRCILPHEAKKKKSGREIVFASDAHTINVEIKGDFRSFEFDHVHGPDADNESVFFQLQSLITSFVDGFNVCIMAYGQTGSGKTHTMLGPEGGGKSGDRDGIIYRSVEDIFKLAETQSVENTYFIAVSVCEVYNNKIRDLLSDDGEETHEVSVGSSGSVDLPTVTKRPATNPDHVLDAINEGMLSRAKRTTDLNEHSSRSHLVVSISNTCESKLTKKKIESKLYMVDLAGSENNKMAKQSGDGLREASNINKSLSALGDVMSSLSMRKSQPKKHIPYRNSTLTLLLKDAIGGNAKTLLLACVSPTEKFSTESVNTLRFGTRVRTVERGKITVASTK
eukprot:m.98037 g.98037  ORF g.98037 m.98037 type:complete len:896 (+) comp8999_c0_seq1:92-2779(+)